MREGENGRTLSESRLDDAAEKASRGSVAILPYLTPQERKRAERSLRSRGLYESVWFFGGYPSAERVCLFLLPEYLCAMLSGPLAQCETDEVSALLCEELEACVCPLRIRGSGYRTLTHRDYLGAILHLGLERDSFGDIAVQNEHEAILFCTRTVCAFLCESLTRVASDAVKCAPCVLDERFTDGRVYQSVSATVASQRLDCVVAALTHLSREEAQAAVRAGLVEVDFEVSDRTDLSLSPPATLSIRGYGRFVLRGFNGETKRGRLRLCADRLV